jgi:hypothetical protein
LQTITKQLSKFRRNRRGISTVISVMLGLVLLVIIVGNVFLTTFQMNQLDSEKLQENLNITNIAQTGNGAWLTTNTEFTVNVGTQTGSYTGTSAVGDGSFETFTEATSQTLFAHMETLTVNANNYYRLLTSEADASGYTVNASMANTGRTLLAKSLYSLSGVSSFSASTWAFFYRAWQDSSASTTITNSPSSCSDSGSGWTNPTNAYSDGTGVAYSQTKDQVENYGGYGFALPAGAQVTEIRVRLDANNGGNDYINLRVSVDGGSSWLSTTYPVYLTSSETTTWVNLTSWTAWSPSQLNGDNLRIQVTHKKSGGSDFVSLDWLPVEVTYRTGSATGHVDVDVKVLQANGQVRTTLATNVAASTNLDLSPDTLSGTYQCSAYNVVDQTDYLEIDYCIDVSSAGAASAHLRLDDMTLATSSQTRVAGVAFSNFFRLSIENNYTLNLQSTPLANIGSLEVLLTYNASSTNERWVIRAYNWNLGAFSIVDFNDTSGTQPSTAAGAWTNYTLHISGDWQAYVSPEGTIKLQIADANVGASQTSLSIDFLSVRALVSSASISLKNSGPTTVHIIALWVNSPTVHNRYDLNLYINAGDTETYTFGADIGLPSDSYTIKVVTERGNIAVNSTI